MDDDIVFLGSSPATATLPHSRPAQRPVTGVSLHVDKNGPIDAHILSFRRAAGTVVHIGRRSALDPEPDDDTTAAMFRCAVVSRRHAKIAFADSGHAYLIDLKSHHGTHVRSAADGLARALTPETPTLLVDGDVITFGKAVGKGDECVRPIVVRVALLHDNGPAHTTPPRAAAQALPTVSPASSKASSGRYGIRTSASSSSSDDSAENDGYSDIEEIPPPLGANASHEQEQEQAPAPSSQTSFGNYPLPFKFKHITALKRFLPPMHVIPQEAPWHALEDRPHAPVYRQPQPGAPATNYQSHFHPTSAELRLPPPAPHTHSMPTFVERPLAHLSGLSQFFFSGRGPSQPSNTSDSNNAQGGNITADANMENAPDESPSVNPAAEAGNTNALPAMTSPPPLLPAVEISEAYKRFMSQREPSYPDLDNIYYDDAVPKLAASDDSQDRPYSPTRDWTLGLQPWDRVFPLHRAKSDDGAGQRVAAVPAGGVPLPVVAVAHLSSASASSSDADADSDSDSGDSDFSAASSRNSERALRERAREKERGGRERGRERATSEPMELASSRSASVAPAARVADKGKGRATVVVADVDEGGEADMDIDNEVEAPVELDALRRRAEKTSQTVIRRIEEAVARLQADLTIHRGQTKATLARHMSQMDVFDGRIREVDAECGVLCLRVETLGERLGVVEMDVASNTEASFNALEAEAEKERASEDMRQEGVHAVQALIAEAQEELRALKALRAEAEAVAAAARQQQQPSQVQEHEQPPVLPSLKRKRDDSDEDADADEAARGSEHEPPVLVVSTTSTAEPSEEEELAELFALEKALAMQSSARDRSIGGGIGGRNCGSIYGSCTPPPPRKRARRVAGLMARTATAVGVGAVVTWTALAFS